MTRKETGGPAFPIALGWIETDKNNGDQKSVDVREVSHGMSLRDYFAARALAPAFPGMSTRDVQYAAEAAYELADAMLAARGET